MSRALPIRFLSVRVKHKLVTALSQWLFRSANEPVGACARVESGLIRQPRRLSCMWKKRSQLLSTRDRNPSFGKRRGNKSASALFVRRWHSLSGP